MLIYMICLDTAGSRDTTVFSVFPKIPPVLMTHEQASQSHSRVIVMAVTCYSENIQNRISNGRRSHMDQVQRKPETSI